MNSRFYDPLMFIPDDRYTYNMRSSKKEYDHNYDHREMVRFEVLRKAFYELAEQALHKNGVNIKVEIDVFDLYNDKFMGTFTVPYEYGSNAQEVLVAAKCYVSHPRDIQYEVKEVDWHTYPSHKLRGLIVQLVKTNVKSVVRKVKNQLREWEREHASLWPTKP